MTADASDRVRIGRLHVRWGGDPRAAHLPATALRLESLLDQANLRPPGMRPGQILILARVDGLPSLTSLTVASPRWLDAVRARLDDLLRRAARPAEGPVPPDAPSVLFEDAADLLIALTRDALTGQVARWYWRRVLPAPSDGSPGAALAAAWSMYSRALPAALSVLAPAEAARAVGLLRPRDVEQVIAALHQGFALPDAALRVTSPAERPALSADASTVRGAEGPPAPPWELWLPEEFTRSLPPRAAYLVGLSRALAAAPTRARTRAFAERSAAWLAAAPGEPGDARLEQPPAPELAVLPAPPVTLAAPSSWDTPAPRDVLEGPRRAWEPAGTPTELGGALYLLNVLAWLGLPGDDLADCLGPWDLVEGLARGLLGPDLARFAADPLWALLAALAGRAPGDSIGAGARDAFRVRSGWLARFAPGAIDWRAWAADGRLTVRADAGFTVLDTPLRGRSPGRALAAEIAAYRAAGIAARRAWSREPSAASHEDPRVAPWLRRWLARLTEFVGWLLAQRLAPDLAPAQMLIEPGRIALSRTHLDLTLSLAQIRLPVRRAGLDVDPGWRPDAGMIVLFHFGESYQ